MPVEPELELELEELLELDELLELEELDEIVMPFTARRNLATLVLQVPVHLVPWGGMVAISLSRLLPRNRTSISMSPSLPLLP